MDTEVGKYAIKALRHAFTFNGQSIPDVTTRYGGWKSALVRHELIHWMVVNGHCKWKMFSYDAIFALWDKLDNMARKKDFTTGEWTELFDAVGEAIEWGDN